MKKIGGLLLILVVLAGAIVWLFPPLTYDLAPFLWTGHHQKVIKERAQELIDHLAKDETAGALEMTDPGFVRQQGENLVKLRLKVLGALVRLAGKDRLRVDQVILGPGGKTATIQLSMQQGNQWKPIDPSRWVRVDGKWYITF